MILQDATNVYAISRYIVDQMIPGTPYTTIQMALDAANAVNIAHAGTLPAIVEVRPGTYTEDLVLYDNIVLTGTDASLVVIVGTHTPPLTGLCKITNVTLQSDTEIIDSNAAGTASFYLDSCLVNVVLDGFLFNILNWLTPSQITIINCGDISTGTNRGIYNISGSVKVDIVNSTVANNVDDLLTTYLNNDMQCINSSFNGMITINNATFSATNSSFGKKLNAIGTTTFSLINCEVGNRVIIQNDTTATIASCAIGSLYVKNNAFVKLNDTVITPAAFVVPTIDLIDNSITYFENCSLENIELNISDTASCALFNSSYIHTTGINNNSSLSSGLFNAVITVAGGNALIGNGVWDVGQIVFDVSNTIDPLLTINNATQERVGNSVSGIGYDALHGNINLPDTDNSSHVGVITFNYDPYIHNYGPMPRTNIFVGNGAGNFTLTSNNSCCFGDGTGASLTSGSANTLIGYTAGTLMTTAGTCVAVGDGSLHDNQTINGLVAIGYQSLASLATSANGHLTFVGNSAGILTDNISASVVIGASALANCNIGPSIRNVIIGSYAGQFLSTSVDNCIIGSSAAYQLLTGQNNCLIGTSAGSNYVGAESNNVILGSNTGVVGESDVVRIGQVGTQTACYVAGIYSETVGAVVEAVIVDNTGKLGSMPLGGLFWTREVNAAVPMVNSHGYINTNVGLTTFTLPLLANIGDEIQIMGESAAGWTIAQNAGQNIQIGNVSTTIGVGGSVSSLNRYDCITIRCRVANTTWSVTGIVGGPLAYV